MDSSSCYSVLPSNANLEGGCRAQQLLSQQQDFGTRKDSWKHTALQPPTLSSTVG